MNKEIADRWVAALRSGDYAQGRGKLRRGSRYCCLGVLCDISEVGVWTKIDGIDGYYATSEGTDTTTVGTLVKQWSGLKTVVGRGPEGVALTDMNDTGASFATIAEYIEKHWEQL